MKLEAIWSHSKLHPLKLIYSKFVTVNLSHDLIDPTLHSPLVLLVQSGLKATNPKEFIGIHILLLELVTLDRLRNMLKPIYV